MADARETDPRSLAELRALVARGAPYSRRLIHELKHDTRAGAQALYAVCKKAQRRIVVEKRRLENMLLYEKQALANGFRVIAGVDEAGRGPYAGPIVAAAVVLAAPVERVNDSKQLTPEEREALYEEIRAGGHQIGVAAVDVEVINQQGIQTANYMAMANAVAQLFPAPDFLLVDGFRIPGVLQPQQHVIKGDCLSQSIAAASIIAKVTRDRIMIELDKQYPGYGFAQHKGYGTPEHYQRITELGPCAIHRQRWGPILRAIEADLLFEWSEEV
ncbi:MAG: ribonuclease HII [Candidatus Hydrogenedentes bacterium]|nr:ribonuclease HII [Candidatus Hydrogenedentota bacterium]